MWVKEVRDTDTGKMKKCDAGDFGDLTSLNVRSTFLFQMSVCCRLSLYRSVLITVWSLYTIYNIYIMYIMYNIYVYAICCVFISTFSFSKGTWYFLGAFSIFNSSRSFLSSSFIMTEGMGGDHRLRMSQSSRNPDSKGLRYPQHPSRLFTLVTFIISRNPSFYHPII